jgi:hypothetical protein
LAHRVAAQRSLHARQYARRPLPGRGDFSAVYGTTGVTGGLDVGRTALRSDRATGNPRAAQ